MFPDEQPLPAVIAVIDTNVLLDFKKVVPVDQQWDLLMEMSKRVGAGSLTFPRQVASELSAVRHPDAPGAWIGSAKRSVQHPEPTEETLVRVLRSPLSWWKPTTLTRSPTRTSSQWPWS